MICVKLLLYLNYIKRMVFTMEIKSAIGNLWDTDPVYVSNTKLKQIFVLAGNGNIYEEKTLQELRQFFPKLIYCET